MIGLCGRHIYGSSMHCGIRIISDLYVGSVVFMYLHCLDLSTFTTLPEHGSLTKIGCNNYNIYGNQK